MASEKSSTGLPPHLFASLFCSAAAESSACTEAGASHVACIGCRLAHTPEIAVVDAFVHGHIAELPPAHLYRLAADLAPAPWSHDWAAIQRHYESHCTSPRIVVATKCREYKAMRLLLTESLRHMSEGGDAICDEATLRTYMKVCAKEREQLALLHSMLPSETGRTAAANRDDRPVATPAEAAPIAPIATVETAESSVCDDAASTASTAMAGYDAATARDALRDALFGMVEACVPKSASAQPTMAETLAGTHAADVASREQREKLRSFQEAAAPCRCFCRAARRGEACHFRIDRAFCERLAEAAPAISFVYKDRETLRAAIQDTLQLRRAPLHTRKHYKSRAIFGFRERKAPTELKRSAA